MGNGCKDFFDHLGNSRMLLGDIISIQDEITAENMTPEQRQIFFQEKLIPLAKKHGFDFTVEELERFINEMSNPHNVPMEEIEVSRQPEGLADTLRKMMSGK